MSADVDFRGLIGPVARTLLGESNKRLSHESKGELRWGNNGSLVVNLREDDWFDHEHHVGGGVLDLILRQVAGCSTHGDAYRWLVEQGFVAAGPNGADAGRSGYGSREVAVYPYVDEEGVLLYEVVRCEPKSFYQRRPARPDDPPDKIRNGRYSGAGALKDVRRVPYRLTELVEAIACGQVIPICEGEKDVDNLRRLNVAATTISGGTGGVSYWPEVAQHFRDADVVILPDNDPAGHKYAEAAGAALAGTARQVRVLALPGLAEKEDVSVWLKHGGTVEALYDLVESHATAWPELPWPRTAGDEAEADEPGSPRPDPLTHTHHGERIDPADWQGKEVPTRDWLVPDWFPRGDAALFSGDGAVGKTTTILQLAVATVRGKDWLGDMVNKPGPAFFISAEETDDELHRRLAAILLHHRVAFKELAGQGLSLFPRWRGDKLLALPDHGIVRPTWRMRRFMDAARSEKPALIAIETSAKVFGEEINRNLVDQFVDLLRDLAIDSGAAVTLLAHPSLTGKNTGSGLSGTTGWHNSFRARTYQTVACNQEGKAVDADLRRIELMKSNYGPPYKSKLVRWQAGVYVLEKTLSPLERAAAEAGVDELFVQLLVKAHAQGRTPNHVLKSPYYAPTMFAGMTGADRVTREAFAAAMERLLKAGKIKIVQTAGPPSKQRPMIVQT